MTDLQKQTIDTLTAEMTEILMFGKRAEHTIVTYKTYAVPFMEYCFDELDKHPKLATEKDVRSFLNTIQVDRELGDRTINNAISSIHFLFEAVLDLKWNKYKVPFRTFDEFIPFVPTKEEVETFISSVQDLKRKAMFVIMYATGMRVCEVCHLHYGDILRSKKRIHVSPSKRRKERYVELPDKCFEVIMEYCRALPARVKASLTSDSWLFPKQTLSADPIYTDYILRYISSIEDLLGWEHRFTSHTFRRAFATHNFLDGNMTMEEIQAALGHAYISTTKIYVRQWVSALQDCHRNSIEGMAL